MVIHVVGIDHLSEFLEDMEAARQDRIAEAQAEMEDYRAMFDTAWQLEEDEDEDEDEGYTYVPMTAEERARFKKSEEDFQAWVFRQWEAERPTPLV